MNREDDHQLWDLLGKSTRPEVSPFFSRNVLRRVRSDEAETGRRTRFIWGRILPASGLIAATAAIFIAYTVSFHPVASNDDDAVAKIDAQDYEVVADLDNLLAADDNSLWDDNTSL